MNVIWEALANLFNKLFPPKKESVREEIITRIPDWIRRIEERKARREKRDNTDK